MTERTVAVFNAAPWMHLEKQRLHIPGPPRHRGNGSSVSRLLVVELSVHGLHGLQIGYNTFYVTRRSSRRVFRLGSANSGTADPTTSDAT